MKSNEDEPSIIRPIYISPINQKMKEKPKPGSLEALKSRLYASYAESGVIIPRQVNFIQLTIPAKIQEKIIQSKEESLSIICSSKLIPKLPINRHSRSIIEKDSVSKNEQSSLNLKQSEDSFKLLPSYSLESQYKYPSRIKVSQSNLIASARKEVHDQSIHQNVSLCFKSHKLDKIVSNPNKERPIQVIPHNEFTKILEGKKKGESIKIYFEEFIELLQNNPCYSDEFCYFNREKKEFYKFFIVSYNKKNENEYLTISKRV